MKKKRVFALAGLSDRPYRPGPGCIFIARSPNALSIDPDVQLAGSAAVLQCCIYIRPEWGIGSESRHRRPERIASLANRILSLEEDFFSSPLVSGGFLSAAAETTASKLVRRTQGCRGEVMTMTFGEAREGGGSPVLVSSLYVRKGGRSLLAVLLPMPRYDASPKGCGIEQALDRNRPASAMLRNGLHALLVRVFGSLLRCRDPCF